MPSLVPRGVVPCPEEGERGRRGRLVVLTELVVGGWPAQQAPPEQELQVVEQDEGRGRGRAAVVLLDQVVPLELPDLVRVLLHLLEGVAGAEPRCQLCCGVSEWCPSSTHLPQQPCNFYHIYNPRVGSPYFHHI